MILVKAFYFTVLISTFAALPAEVSTQKN